MKNIHTLPKNESSRLHKAFDKTFILSNELTGESDLYHSKPYHLYVTSNETVPYNKQRWIIDNRVGMNGFIHQVSIVLDTDLCPEIILTTDPVLISKGIQAIDEDFLQWFVGNQTVDYVEVGNYGSRYKVILPPTTVDPVKQPNKETIPQMAKRFWDVNRVKQLAFINGATHVQQQIPSIIKQFLSQHQNDYLLNHVDEWCRGNIK